MTLIFSQKKITNVLNNKSTLSDIKSYYEFCTFFSLHQLIKAPTCITFNSVTIIDHILASYPEIVIQQGIIDVGLSDHQLIFCTRKSFRIKRRTHKHIKFHSFKHYSAYLFMETLTNTNFHNYQSFNDATEVYDGYYGCN